MSDYGPGLPRSGRSMRERTSALLTGALGSAILMIALVCVMWAIEIVDYVQNGRLDRYGIVAHETDGLPGILFAPFLHAGFGHLMANSLPLLILGCLAAIRGIGRFLAASLVIVLVSGLGVWFTSPPNTLTIGASGLVFGYFGYVVARGLFDRRALDIVLGVVVAVLYYSILWGALPTQPGVSWQGHLFGLIGGVIAAWLLRRRTT
ncbi:rhomboid family intramembrane serine protease [Microbispora rosea subsp. aerata]|nr:rhomboid family intramembrane serine protease [Microbispora rosea]GGO06005.1 rhomboid family intramembrane serine protease [Microbispora rosea subsp. aerata]GIH55209.1 rhomboid family intramembrane serine protease [Microbispora rosea subsp. aerata]GLJ82659.1 rhomboid family intramembrane serine protease [Microbispora rosea subsp. aerata]